MTNPTRTSAGEGSVALGGPSPVEVPRLLHHVWMGPAMPEKYAVFREAWWRLHPDWKACLWTEDRARTLLDGRVADYFDRAETIVRGNPWQFRSDLVRYQLMVSFGGVYVDCDTEPVKPLDDLCRVPCWLAWERQDVWVGNSYLGAVKGHPLFKRLLADLPESVHRYANLERANKVSGPQYLTALLKRQRMLNSIEVYPQRFFYPYSYNELNRSDEQFADAYAVHHWNNARRRQRVPL